MVPGGGSIEDAAAPDLRKYADPSAQTHKENVNSMHYPVIKQLKRTISENIKLEVASEFKQFRDTIYEEMLN